MWLNVEFSDVLYVDCQASGDLLSESPKGAGSTPPSGCQATHGHKKMVELFGMGVLIFSCMYRPTCWVSYL